MFYHVSYFIFARLHLHQGFECSSPRSATPASAPAASQRAPQLLAAPYTRPRNCELLAFSARENGLLTCTRLFPCVSVRKSLMNSKISSALRGSKLATAPQPAGLKLSPKVSSGSHQESITATASSSSSSGFSTAGLKVELTGATVALIRSLKTPHFFHIQIYIYIY